MKILLYGHELLDKPEFDRVTENSGLVVFRNHMKMKMMLGGLRGLAAPQLGIPLQIVMIRQEDGTLVDLVNPYILRMYGAEYRHFETCISCPPPDNNCKVDRMQIIEVMAGTVENPGLEREWRFKGIDSRVVQHEIDHLSGTFFFDRANLNDRAKVIERFQQWKLKDKGESNGNGNSTKTQAVHSRAFTT